MAAAKTSSRSKRGGRGSPSKPKASVRPPKRRASKNPPPRRYPVCGHAFRGHICQARGEHVCVPRAARAVAVFEELLVHTKSHYARQAFVLEDWQKDEIVVPIFGTVTWSDEHDRYVRRYRIVWIELARKNGKSELLAGIALILLIADDEEGAEIYGAAKDTKQARKVWDVAERMVKLSPTLSARLKVNKQEKKIYDEQTGSYYEVVTSDAAGELGGNPHGIIFDEVLTQPNSTLWDALQTGFGARIQPMMVAATTAGDSKASFAFEEHEYCRRVVEDPDIDRQRFVFMRNAPDDADPFDERNWYWPNPALGKFLSLETLRAEANEAKLSPLKLARWKQFRLNMWGIKSAAKLAPIEVWDAATVDEDGDILEGDEESLAGEFCYGGLELASSFDIASLVWDFPLGEGDDREHVVLWRFFVPEGQLPDLVERTNGHAQDWAGDGLLTVTDGNVIDYDAIFERILDDADQFKVAEIAYHRWGMAQLATDLQEEKLTVVPISQTMSGLSPGTKELERLLFERKYRHGAHPVARWMFDNMAVRTDTNENLKPDRDASDGNITGLVAAVMALGRAAIAPAPKKKRVAGF